MEARTLERRRHPRHTPAREITGKVKSTMDFRVVDISEGGVLVETRLGLPPATECELRLTVQGQEMVIKATVRRCRAQLTKTDDGCKVVYRSGLEFGDLDADATIRVRNIIVEYCNCGGTADGVMTATAGEVVSGSFFSV
ncbi:MAG: PilZ domain-containing protein [Thermoanaerobaculales bacterium]|jgi:hypothetical protein|nr:PilZ domain-containing protein [Thermoanaerobaculales bacterium]